jgi:hypothetical protein
MECKNSNRKRASAPPLIGVREMFALGWSVKAPMYQVGESEAVKCVRTPLLVLWELKPLFGATAMQRTGWVRLLPLLKW